MEILRKKRKKGVSVVVSYVLLIVITLSLSIGGYIWLKRMIIAPESECPEGVSILIENYECLGDRGITLNLENTGRFNIDGVLIKASTSATGVISCVLGAGKGEPVFFVDNSQPSPLKPGEKKEIKESYDRCKPSISAIEMTPIKLYKGNTLLCDKSVVSQDVDSSKCV